MLSTCGLFMLKVQVFDFVLIIHLVKGDQISILMEIALDTVTELTLRGEAFIYIFNG